MVSKRGDAWSTVPGTLGRGRGARAVAVGSPPPTPDLSPPPPPPAPPSLSQASHMSQPARRASGLVGRRGPAPRDCPWPGGATWGPLLGVGPLKCHPMAGEQKP